VIILPSCQCNTPEKRRDIISCDETLSVVPLFQSLQHQFSSPLLTAGNYGDFSGNGFGESYIHGWKRDEISELTNTLLLLI